MSLDDLLVLLDRTPVVADIHPVSTCYLPKNVAVLDSASKVAWQLDDPDPLLPERILITSYDTQYTGRFPHIRCEHDPFTPALNTILFDRYDDVASKMLRQSQITERIIAEADQYELVALFLVDGLSYQDVRGWVETVDYPLNLEPCLVDVPTLTHTAFPNIIGEPPVAARLFDIGYHRRLGFTYWTRESNILTDLLFRTIPVVNVASDLVTILAGLRRIIRGTSRQKTYVQIVRSGLDGYAHHQKRKPPVAAIVGAILNEMLSLADLFRELDLSACIYLTADHGILWRDEFEPQVIGHAPSGASPRSCQWRDLYQQDEPGRRFVVSGQEFYCLGYPKLRRPLHIDEQGVHGGVSFQESIVPLLTMKVGDTC